MGKDGQDKPKVSLKRRFARFIARVAVLVIAAVWVIQELWGESEWWAVYVTYPPPIIYLAIPATAALLSVLCVDRVAFLWSLGAGALCLVTVAQPSLGLERPQSPPADTIRIVTWNLHGETDCAPEVRARLQELEPDIVCLQEAFRPKSGEYLPGAEVARAGTAMVLTTGELTDARSVGPDDDSVLRRPMEATVSLPQGELRVLNAHLFSFQLAAALKHPSREKAQRLTQRAVNNRSRQVEIVLDWLDEQSKPVVVAGDFNTPPRGRLYGRLRGRLTDSFAAVGRGFGWSFPHRFPMLRIDYVWLDPGLTPVHCEVLDVGPSDHRPVVVDFVLRGEGRGEGGQERQRRRTATGGG
jgi:vancomycin resistance protein VanJ